MLSLIQGDLKSLSKDINKKETNLKDVYYTYKIKVNLK